jgi:hypothetical protein
MSSYSGTQTTIDPNDNDIVWNATDNRWEVSFDVAGFSGFFAQTTSTVLPLDLLGFSAHMNHNKTVSLQWHTASEINTSSFDIERSTDGKLFKKIVTVKAIGSGNNDYQTIDNQPLKGINYYRLRMNDIDGQYTYSKVVTLYTISEKSTDALIYPNPAYSELILERPLSTTATVRIFNLTGQLQKQLNTQTTHTRINIEDLTAGVYFFSLHTEGGAWVQKFVKR